MRWTAWSSTLRTYAIEGYSLRCVCVWVYIMSRGWASTKRNMLCTYHIMVATQVAGSGLVFGALTVDARVSPLWLSRRPQLNLSQCTSIVLSRNLKSRTSFVSKTRIFSAQQFGSTISIRFGWKSSMSPRNLSFPIQTYPQQCVLSPNLCTTVVACCIQAS